MQPTLEQINAIIERSGHLMEQRIANLFKEDQRLWGWSVEPNCAFPDDETGKSREIDLLAGNRQTFASRGLNGPGTYDQLQRIVLIEAKTINIQLFSSHGRITT